MSAAGAISNAANVVSTTAGGFADMTSEQFIKVMIQELAHQDPFEPQDSQALLEQLSSLRNIESQLALEEQLGALVLQNQIAAAGGLIGKLVAGTDSGFDQIQGVVTSVRVQDDAVWLELDTGKTMAMNSVTEIADVAQ